MPYPILYFFCFGKVHLVKVSISALDYCYNKICAPLLASLDVPVFIVYTAEREKWTATCTVVSDCLQMLMNSETHVVRGLLFRALSNIGKLFVNPFTAWHKDFHHISAHFAVSGHLLCFYCLIKSFESTLDNYLPWPGNSLISSRPYGKDIMSGTCVVFPHFIYISPLYYCSASHFEVYWKEGKCQMEWWENGA